jgi:hypothetical protein
VSYNRFSIQALCSTIMTAALAGMGAAYSRLSEESHPESDLQNEDDLAKNQTSSLLCLSTGAFLIASSVINALGQGKVSAG